MLVQTKRNALTGCWSIYYVMWSRRISVSSFYENKLNFIVYDYEISEIHV